MSVQQTLEADPGRLRATGPADTREGPSWYEFDWQGFKAGVADAAMDVPGRSNEQRQGEMLYAAAELAAMMGKQPTAYYITIPGDAALVPMVDEAGFWRDLQQVRVRKPGAFAHLGRDRADYEARRKARLASEAQDRARLMDRQGFLGNLAAGAVGGLTDPINLATMPLGFGAAGAGWKAVTGSIVKNGLLNAGIEVAQAPFVAAERNVQGRDFPLQEFGMRVGGASVGGAALDAVGKGVAKGAQAAWDSLPVDYRMARALEQAVPNHGLTREELDAISIIYRDQEVIDASPYVRTYGADEAHAAKIDEILTAWTAPPTVRPAAPPSSLLPPRTAGETAIDAAAQGLGDIGMAEVKALIRGPESDGDDGATNRMGSSASGRYQFVEGTFKGLWRKVYGTDPEAAWRDRRFDVDVQERLMDRLLADNAAILRREGVPVNAGNLYIMHVLGSGNGPKLLRAAPETPVASLLSADIVRQNPTYFGDGRTVAQALAEIRKRVGGGGDIDVAVPDVPIVRPAALDAERPLVTAAGRELPIASFRPDEIGVDAGLMQFKSGGDAQGVTERLRGVSQWDPMAAGMVTVWQAKDGRLLIADGHQRLGLARRIAAQGDGQDIRLNAFVLREEDGFSARDARVLTALKNIGEGTGTATDAAKVFRDVGLDSDGVFSRLPPKSALVRDGRAISRLSDEAFGAVVNEVIPENWAAVIGSLVPDPENHMAMVQLLKDLDPPNRAQAESIVRQALDAGFRGETQEELFGSRDLVTALFANKARALDKTLAELRKLKGAFGVAVRNAEALDAAGNRIDVDASGAAVESNARALALIQALALRKGNAVSDLFNAAAQRLADGEPLARVVKSLVGDIRKLDVDGALGQLDRPVGADAGSRGADDAAEEARPAYGPDDELTPATIDELEAAGQAGFGFVDEPAHKAFDDPAGEGAAKVAQSDWHDIRVEPESAGPFGPVFTDFDPGDWRAVVQRLSDAKTGEVRGALNHKDIGPIDVVWGKEGTGKHDGYGLAKIMRFHPDVVDDLPAIVARMEVVEPVSGNRVNLISDDHRAGVRLDWDGQQKTWLITAFTISRDAPAAADVNRAAANAQAGNFPALEAGPSIDQIRAEANAEAPLFDLDDGKGPRTVADIDQELTALEQGIEAIRRCQL